MKATAEYRDGVLILREPIRPKGSILHVEIPDAELEAERRQGSAAKPEAAAGSLQEELNEILGSIAPNRPAAPIAEDREMLVDTLAERHEL